MAAVGMEGADLALEVHTSSSLRRITNSKDRIVTPGEQHTARDGCSVSPSIQSDKVDGGERGVAGERGGSGDGGDTAAYVPLVWPLAWHPTDKVLNIHGDRRVVASPLERGTLRDDA